VSGYYRITHYVSLSEARNGLLYPVYNQADNNIPYVHEIDEDYRIADFIEAFDLDGFHTVPAKSSIQHALGDYCPLAYFDHRRSLVETDLNELRLGFAGLKEGVLTEIGTLPTLTRLHIARALQRPLGEQAIIWQEFAKAYLSTEEARRVYLQAQIATTTAEGKIWKSIRETTPTVPSVFDQDAFFGEMDDSQLRIWLTRNRNDFRFPYGWLRLDKTSRPDEQMYRLGIDWFLSNHASMTGVGGAALAIFGRLMRMFILFEPDRDFTEFAIDSFDEGDIFRYVPPLDERLVLEFLNNLLETPFGPDEISMLFNALRWGRLSREATTELVERLSVLTGYGKQRRRHDPYFRSSLIEILEDSAHIQNLRYDDDELDELISKIIEECNADLEND
jgi:hypothetical protein